MIVATLTGVVATTSGSGTVAAIVVIVGAIGLALVQARRRTLSRNQRSGGAGDGGVVTPDEAPPEPPRDGS